MMADTKLLELKLDISDAMEMHDAIRYKKFISSCSRKVLLQGFAGEDVQRKTGRWMQKERIIDPEHDRFREVVVDPVSGQLIHFCDEPLSQHRGHGSARRS